MKIDIKLEATIVEKFALISPQLNEWCRRIWAAAESKAIGYSGDALVSRATGIDPGTIWKGRREIASGGDIDSPIRKPGWGGVRNVLEAAQPGLIDWLESMVAPVTRGDSISPFRLTCKCRSKPVAAITRQGWKISSTTVGRYSHPDRNAQFEYINIIEDEFHRKQQPTISVDTKKKKLVGVFKNSGREWQPKGTPEKPFVHDTPAVAVASSRQLWK